MLELMFCSLLTIVPDYLYRRYWQGKRFGKEITLYSVWFELRWGITACVILTVCLITTIFYNHPSTSNVTLFFRTVPIVPEINGRVAEVYVGVSGPIKQGEPIFRLDSSKQQAAVDGARHKIAEIGAEMTVAWEHDWDAVHMAEGLRGSGFEIAAIETSLHAVDLFEWQPRFPVCVAFGNEVEGLRPELLEMADAHVRIPMLGQKESLNVATAGGIVMYELLRKFKVSKFQSF